MLVNERGVKVSEIIDEMKNNGVISIVNVCGNEQELNFSKTVSAEFKNAGINFFSVAGYHPHEAEKYISSDAGWIVSESSLIIAVGEVGLDFHYDFSPRETQRKMLRKMIEVSLEVSKPLIMHGRNGEDEIIETLLEYGLKDKKVLFHCYTGTQESAEKIFRNGWHIAFSGIVTFKRSGELAEILKNGDREKIFFETDSPFLSPVPFRGRINTPAKVRYVYEFASEILQIDSECLQKSVKRNFENFFGVNLF